jgi:nicotinate-nucleotide adenylyltransferase
MIGIFGGTFDPVHFGHLRAACEVLEQLELTEVRLVPCGDPAHREPARAGARDRLAMVQLAAAGAPGLVVDDRELHRPGPSYMVDTLDSLRSEVPGAALCLILGMDAFLGLASWSRWQRILELAHIAVLQRPGVEMPDRGVIAELLQAREIVAREGFMAASSGRIMFVPITQLHISATQIRDILAAGRRADYLTPASVLDYIRSRHLYVG